MKIGTSVEQFIGNTPLVELGNIEKKLGLKAHILAKLEYFNPAGSVKDRVAKFLIDDAEKRGVLRPGAAIVEPTSGNTGIGLASVGAVRGYKVILTMPANMSQERIRLIKAYGAEVVLTDVEKGMGGAVENANELANAIPGAVILGQFDNAANPAAHYASTGPEIYDATEGKTHFFVAGVGTGGTLSGAGKFLKERIPSVKIVAVEPASSPLLTKGRTGAHGIQGIGANFIPETLDKGIYDCVMDISDDDAYRYARMTGREEGFLSGISSGAALAAAVSIAKRDENVGKNIVVILPDGGDRYMSTPLFS